MIINMKRTRDVVDDSRRVVDGFKKHCKQLNGCFVELTRIIEVEEKNIAKIEYKNDPLGASILDLAGPVIRMRDLEEKLKNAIGNMRNFTQLCDANVDQMEQRMLDKENAEENAEETREFEERFQKSVIRYKKQVEQRQAVIKHGKEAEQSQAVMKHEKAD